MNFDDHDFDKARFFTSGPSRVMVNEQGHAVSSERARQQYKTSVDIVFLRNDGWSLGAPKEFEMQAYKTWPEDWVAFIRRPNHNFEAIAAYKPPEIN